MDGLMKMLGIEPTPEFYAAKAEYKARYLAAEVRYCANGCANHYDPLADKPFTGMGIAGCPEPECN